MLFNTIEFACLLALVIPAYFLLRHRNRQNVLLLLASYVFYGWWDYRFLSLLIVSTLTDYCVGLWLEATPRRRSRIALLVLSLSVNLGLLAVFKYWDLFASTANGTVPIKKGCNMRRRRLGPKRPTAPVSRLRAG